MSDSDDHTPVTDRYYKDRRFPPQEQVIRKIVLEVFYDFFGEMTGCDLRHPEKRKEVAASFQFLVEFAAVGKVGRRVMARVCWACFKRTVQLAIGFSFLGLLIYLSGVFPALKPYVNNWIGSSSNISVP